MIILKILELRTNMTNSTIMCVPLMITYNNKHFGRREQHDSDTDDKDDDDNGHVNIIGDEESSVDNSDNQSYDSHQHDSDSYYNSGNAYDSKLNYQNDNPRVNQFDDDSDDHLNDLDEVANPVARSILPHMVRDLGPRGNDGG